MAKNKKRKKKKVQQTVTKFKPDQYIKKNGRFQKLIEVYISNDIQAGVRNIVVVRQRKNGNYILVSYLVDLFCMGIKDTFSSFVEEDEYFPFLQRMLNHGLLEIADPNYAFNLIYQAHDYAQNIGIPPAKSFSITKHFLPLRETLEAVSIEFGLNGKPHYMPSAEENSDQIIKLLNETIGEDGYTFSNVKQTEIFTDEFEDFFRKKEDFYTYLSYKSIYYSCKYLFEDHLEELKSMLLNKSDRLADKIIKELELQEIEIDSVNNKDLFSVAENYLIHHDVDFINEEYVLRGFDSLEEDPLFILGSKSILFNYGKTKVENLLLVFGAMHAEDEPPTIAGALKEVDSWRNNFNVLAETNPFIFSYLAESIIRTEDHFGRIDATDFNDSIFDIT